MAAKNAEKKPLEDKVSAEEVVTPGTDIEAAGGTEIPPETPPESDAGDTPNIRVIDEEEAAEIVRKHESQELDPAVINDRNQLRKLEESSVEFHLSRIVGGVIDGISLDEDRGIYGLNITIKGIQEADRKVTAWILADAEGNGPGHLDIQE